MDPVFELVKELEPEALPPSTAARRRQHDALMLAIGEEDLAARHGSGRRRYLRRGPVVGVVVGILALTGGGIAAAVTLSSPTPQQSTSIYSHYYPDAGAGRVAGTRPTLNSEEVLCDYQGAGELPAGVRYGPVGDAFASAAPLTTPLTAQMLVNACSTVAPTGAVVPASVPATLCETATPSSVTDTPAGWPVVIFGDETCSSSGYVVASSDLLAQVNHRRVIEATLDAVPEACPTQSQALDWVHQQLSALGIAMQVTSWYGGPGGSCYLPFVQWWWPPAGASLVQVTASEQAGNPPGSDTTTTLAG
jgi:hypothetical protein